MRVKSLFYKKIKCGECGSNFKLKKERGVNRYLCSKYDNGKGCQRITIEEDKIVKLINKRFGRELTDEMSNEEIREVVVKIIVRSERLFDIHLTEGRPISFHERGIVF